MHRINAVEWDIRTRKYHFISGLASAYTQFPMHLWCRLIPPATMNLNMFRTYQRNPTILAPTSIESPFDFNKTYLAPPGIKVLVHKKTQQRKTWGIHGLLGWYIGHSMYNYR